MARQKPGPKPHPAILAARAASDVVYFTGVPCRFGHVAQGRYTSTGICVECAKLKMAKRVAAGGCRYPLRCPSTRGLPKPSRSKPEACECCGRMGTDTRSGLNLDHDHSTHVFRGWLCSRCNTGLGLLGDDMVAVLKMVEYLRRAEGG